MMQATLTINSRGVVTLPAKLRQAMGLKPDDQLIAETTPQGLLLRPAITLPLEMYTPERVQEFDAAEAELAAVLSRRQRWRDLAMRIFLDANILFSAARSAGAIRQLLHDLHADSHALVADEYVATEARRNVAAKATDDAVDYLQALLARIEVSPVQRPVGAQAACSWLPEKDRPVLMAAMALKCDALVTGDRSHFGPGYGKTFEGVTIYSPAQLAQAIWLQEKNPWNQWQGCAQPPLQRHASRY
jgi:bifunctional DNA-binding transcriptional regulator/antitoxin component of YhaV-PrlF toxin-antitoxin module/predicted nucleic acid-binding protein